MLSKLSVAIKLNFYYITEPHKVYICMDYADDSDRILCVCGAGGGREMERK